MKVTIVGAGVVGKATGRGLRRIGHRVNFVDVDPEVIRVLNDEGFSASLPEDIDLSGVDAVLVSVPTPSSEAEGLDLSHLIDTSRFIGVSMRKTGAGSQLVVVYRSTVTPGITRHLIGVLAQNAELEPHTDFGVCYWPEYLRAASAENDFMSPRLITIGGNQPGDWASKRIGEMCERFDAEIFYCDYRSAELQKLGHNSINAVTISMFNELRWLAQKLGVDSDLILHLIAVSSESRWNPWYGTRDRGAYDGPCLPKDATMLLACAREIGMDMTVLDAAQKFNAVIAGK